MARLNCPASILEMRPRACWLPQPADGQAAIGCLCAQVAQMSRSSVLFARPVAALAFSTEKRLFSRRQCARLKPDGHLVEFAAETERDLIVPVVHRRTGIRADVEVLVPLQDNRDRTLHGLGGHDPTVDLEHAGCAPGRCR
jgi:hypothetical protein